MFKYNNHAFVGLIESPKNPDAGVYPGFSPTASSLLVDGGGHEYGVKIAISNVSSTNLTNIINYVTTGLPSTYNLNS